MQVGLVGAPSAGKSTFFKAASLAEAEIASYPFTTIKPNVGMGYVKIECVDKEFGKQCNPRAGFCLQGSRFVPVELIDVAGLVPGAHKGEGMGNQFLNDLNQADVLIHVVDASGENNELGKQVGDHDPCVTVRFLEEEIDLWYLSVLEKALEKFDSQKKDLEKIIAKQMSAFKVSEDLAKTVLRQLDLLEKPPSAWDKKLVAKEFRLRTKPMVIAANKMDHANSKANLERMKKEFPEYQIIPCSADYELALREAAKREMIEYVPGSSDFKVLKELPEQLTNALNKIKKFLEENERTGVQRILDTAVLDVLGFVAVFPGGVNNLEDSQGRILPDCFLLKKGSTARDFAFKIHTSIGKGMLYAMNVKNKMKIGKDYEVKHRDVIEIISTA